MEILETKGRKMNKIKREERENLHTFSDTTYRNLILLYKTYKSLWIACLTEFDIHQWNIQPFKLLV